MAGYDARLTPIQTLAGVQPSTDKTPISTQHYTHTRRIRFRNGLPEKVGGYVNVEFDLNKTIDGVSRTVFSDLINGIYYTVIGTNEKLYSLIGSSLENITPLQETSVSAADSLDTHYDVLSDPFSAVSGSNVVTVTDSEAGLFRAGDIVTFSGATGFAGLSSGDLTGDFIIRSIGVGEYTINVANDATSTTTGGGSVNRSSGLITVNFTAHGNNEWDRVGISDANDTGGILATQINTQFIIRNVTTDSFDVMTQGTATSSVSAGGGAGTEYFEEIPDGNANESVMIGYGVGLYGVGLYGVSKQSNLSRSFPRIWFVDRYANTMVVTPGNQGGLYQWMGSNQTAPVQISNAPTQVNYAFVSDNILVTFGAGGIENRIFASDQNDIEEWSSSSVNQVYDDDIEGAGRLLSHVPVEDYNLIFTEWKTYTMRWIGLPFVWEIKPLDEVVGIIAPMARVSVNGIAYWMGQENFYMYRGGTVEIIPANSQPECTALKYVFDDLNYGQKSKIFAWYNKEFNEVWWHYPSANSNDPNRVIRVCLTDMSWSIDEWNRTAAEYPNITQKNPRLMNVGEMLRHEVGYNDNETPMEWSFRTPKRYLTKDNQVALSIIPDSIYDGDISVNIRGFKYPQSRAVIYDNTYTVGQDEDENLERISIQFRGRVWDYTFSGNDLNQYFLMGQWFEESQTGAPQS